MFLVLHEKIRKKLTKYQSKYKILKSFEKYQDMEGGRRKKKWVVTNKG